MTIPREYVITPGLARIDLRFQETPGIIAAYLLNNGNEAALVETGPATTLPRLIEGVRACGVELERITHVLVTHIHLDHAGAAGALFADHLPNARLHVHPRGAPHLADPTRLLASAQRIYGESMDRLWGSVRSVPEERIVPVRDGETVRVGGRELTAIDTPGHARHHHAWLDATDGTLFTGDVAGIRLTGSGLVRPPTPPPEIDLQAWDRSIARLRELSPERLCLTHFGAFHNASAHLDRMLSGLHRWAGRVEAFREAGLERDGVVRTLKDLAEGDVRAAGDDPGQAARYETAIDTGMCLDGLLRALR